MNFRGTTVLLKPFSLSYSQETTAKQKSKRSQTADGFSGQTVDFGNLQRKESLQAEKQGVRDVTIHTPFYLARVAGVKKVAPEKPYNHDV